MRLWHPFLHPSLTPSRMQALRLAASKMTGAARRVFQAEMTLKCCRGSARLAETIWGWSREAVAVGLADHRPSPSTMAEVFNRRGYRLRKVLKAKPQKKIKETDAIFAKIKKSPPGRGREAGQTLEHGL